MFFFTGRNHQVRLSDHTTDALTTPFEDWCSRERRDPDVPESWFDFELTRPLRTDPAGPTAGVA